MARVDVAIGVVRDKIGRILIARRKDDAHLGGFWEFPGGKFEGDEDASEALNRELFEELNIKPKSSSSLIKVNYSYPDINVQLHVREVHDFEGTPVSREGQSLKWLTLHELNNYTFPEANKPILSAIKLGRQYAIIGGKSVPEVLLELDDIAKQGVSLVQIRVKGLSELDTEKILEAARIRCHELSLTYLINSQMPVKNNQVDEGVHLTSSDLMSLSQRPENTGFVGASCHSLQELRKVEELALDFAVLSPVMPTSSHPEARALGWQQFGDWVAEVNIPVFALGGIRKQDFEQAITSGAQGISGISLFSA
ncbi:MAG: Nudix family hydrolase [Gammaproteobacteria bacterium]|jgi:8-oxo-dGTP diphosphatase|nr:Nudix family hydrolase [Gammaproteobacteria bacterium]MBT5223187.1 Nudix family hydrolase [Gammaproteobacteria bacterium]MBT5825890.1 Nudix family hydrolase [Gammaproteobacteria bacterium]MBT6420245.1 Nudix family hydrolase [Gammaproteobacteria bacterium]MBT6574986.1 Nudix family hydrolase [Gammaproteobacteria bacterium]